MADFPAYCADLLTKAKSAGFGVLAERKLDYGRQYELSDGGGAKATLSCYHGKKGFSFVLGGKHAEVLGEALGGGVPTKAAPAGAQLDPFNLGFPRIGGDESGKGDFFGPLVVAAFYVEEKGAQVLQEMGVADCKTLSDAAVERLAGLLEPGKLTKGGIGHVIALMPREYNPRYADVGNLNLLLSQLHGECVNELMLRLDQVKKRLVRRGTQGPRAVLIDQFATNTSALATALNLPPGCDLVTRTGGEADIACAAASVLARAEFLRSLRVLGGEYGQELPPGAGTPTIKAARDFKKSFGSEELPKVAKTHFKTMESL
jgi:ribonuclease HIII